MKHGRYGGSKHKEPEQVDHIRLAHEKGIGRMDIENLDVKRIEV